MDTPFDNAPMPPPPLPMRLPSPPALPGAPGPGAAIGFIALYFLLQFAIGFVASLVVGVVVCVRAGMQPGHVDVAAWEPRIQAALEQPDMRAFLTVVVLSCAAMMILWLVRKKWPYWWSMSRPPGLGFVMPASSAFFVVAIAFGIAAPMLGGLLTKWLAGHHAVHQDVQQLGTQAQWGARAILALLVVTLGPLVEELLFRGVLLSALLRQWAAGWAVAVTSLLFVLIHLPGMNLQWYALPDLLLLALALAWIRLKSGSIWPAVLTHAINNALAVTVWFVAVKPPG
jgi:hypothetical protein